MTNADRGHGSPRRRAAPAANASNRFSGTAHKNLVIVAAGDDGLDAERSPRASKAPAAADNGMLGASITADTPDAAHSFARSPARPSDTSIAALSVVADRHAANALRGCGTR